MTIRDLKPSDYPAVIALGESLHEWFDENGRRMIGVDVQTQRGIVAEVVGKTRGFILYYTNQAIGWIGWMGVDLEYQRRGIGTAMLEEMLARLREAGATEVRVSTLGDSVDYPPYERTRAFYLKNGFTEFKRKLHNRESMPEELILRRMI